MLITLFAQWSQPSFFVIKFKRFLSRKSGPLFFHCNTIAEGCCRLACHLDRDSYSHMISAVKFQWYNNQLQWFSNVTAVFPLYYFFLLNCFFTAGTSLAKSNFKTTQQPQQWKSTALATVLFQCFINGISCSAKTKRKLVTTKNSEKAMN